MKKHSTHYLILFILCLTSAKATAQKTYMKWTQAPKTAECSIPTFPGGEEALRKYIESNLKYPESAISAEIQGEVTVKFAIAPTGETVNIRITDSLSYACDSAVIDLVRNMPKWIATSKDKISEELTLPIIFSLPYDYQENGKKVYKVPEQFPSFPGGENELSKFINKNLKYPIISGYNIRGRVTIRFIVTTEGKITDINILRGIDKRLDAEACRLVKSMPDWIPAMYQGEKVDAYFTLPVVFRLQ